MTFLLRHAALLAAWLVLPVHVPRRDRRRPFPRGSYIAVVQQIGYVSLRWLLS